MSGVTLTQQRNPTYINVADFGVSPANAAAQNDAALARILASLPACDVYDGANNKIVGQTGALFFPPGVYKLSALLALPAGSITIQGSGMSSWIPIMSLTPYEDLGGTAIVTTNVNGLMSTATDTFGNPVTSLYLRDMDLRTVSPATAQTTSTPAILNLNGWLSGEVSNVNVIEVQTAGGPGTNLYKIIDCSPGGARDTSLLSNVRGFGGNIAITLAGSHITAIGLTGGWTGHTILSYAVAIDIKQNLGCYFANLHCHTSNYGIGFQSYDGIYVQQVIYGAHFESVDHYLRADASNMVGVLIIENPCWNSTPVPTTDIPAQLPATTYLITKYEQDETGGTKQSYHFPYPYQLTVLNDSPIRYYRLNEASGTVAKDLGSQAHDGTISGTGVTYSQAGLVTSPGAAAMLFDGTAGKVTLPQTGLPTGASPWTLEAWMQLPVVPGSDYRPLVGFGSFVNQEEGVLYARTSLGMTLSTSGGDADSGGGLLQPGAAAHIIGTYDGTNLRLYINSVQQAFHNPGVMNIILAYASIANAGGAYLNATISEVAIYTTAFSPAQIARHYLAGLGLGNG